MSARRDRPPVGDWADDAGCKGHTATMFPRYRGGSQDRGEYVAAKQLCATCPVTDQCLEHAIRHREREGVWGGTTPTDRLRIIRRRRYAA